MCIPRFPHLRLVLALALLAGGSGRAQQAKFEGLTIRSIQFDPVRQPLEASELHEILPLKIGAPLRQEEVRASIERLFATGRYADIQVDATEYSGGVVIRFLTQSAWFIGHVSVSGRVASPPTEAQLESAARLDLGQPFDESKLTGAAASERRLLESNGLYHSSVHPVLDWETGKDYQQVNIRFEVDSGARARFTAPALSGDPKLDPARILAATSFRRWITHAWKPVTQERMRQGVDGVRKLYLEDRRLEARVALESVKYDAARNTVQPTLRIDAGPRIEVRTVGAKVSQGKLRRYIPVFEEHSVDRDLLVEGAHNLRDYFQSNGYYSADVQFEERAPVGGVAAIDYLIHPGDRHKLVAIGIHGNRYFSQEQLRERMYLRPAYFLEFPHGRYSENLLRRDEDSIATLYRSNGFSDVKVSHRVVDEFAGRPSQIAVFLEIDEGRQQFIRSLAVDGIQSLDKRPILAALSSIQGQPFSEFNVAVDRDAILEKYFEAGFPSATFEWTSKPAGDGSQVDLDYTVREGNRQFVREVIYTGNRTTKARLINRTLGLNPGDPLSPTAITDTQRRLYGLGVFARVDAATQAPDGDTDRKYVLYDLEEARRYSLALGLGAEIARIGGCTVCLDSPGGQTGFSPRISLNMSRTNLWGIAHSLSLRLRASTLEQQALLTYTWPQFANRPDLKLSITGLADNSKDVRTFSDRRAEGSLQLSERLSKATTFFYRYTYRGVTIDEATLKITPFLVPLLSQPVRVGMLSWGLVQDHRDDPIEPHSGYYNTVDLGLAEHVLGSKRDFLRFLGRNASYYRLSRKFVLARSLEFGEIYAFLPGGHPLDAVPLPERFFGGGGTSHRGFPEEQAGPRDFETGFPIGGTAQLFNQTELRFPLIGEDIGAVLFHDMGNTYDQLSDISFRVHQRDFKDFNYMVHAAGLGLRYRTPVGPLRVDFAYSINPPRFFGFKGTEANLLSAGTNPCAVGGPYANLCVQTGVSHLQFFFSIGQTF